VEVNHAGIARSARTMDDEGCFLLLRTKVRYEVGVLDAALPPDEGDSPANGGWFRTKPGWVLLLEGFASERDPFVADLVSRMQAAGIEGTLTGASSARDPVWSNDVPYATQLAAVIGFRPQPGRRWLDDGWIGGPEQEPAVIDVGARWLAGVAQTVIFGGPHGFSSWSEPAAAARLTVRGLPLAEVSVAMVTHRDWASLSRRGPEDGELYAGHAFRFHPERWAQFIPEPSGIQVLTNAHLDAAHDLSGWVTTRLDENHVLVEARDLGPWYAEPRRENVPVPDEILLPARRDFGDMLLTPQLARGLSLDTKPDFQTHTIPEV